MMVHLKADSSLPAFCRAPLGVVGKLLERYRGPRLWAPAIGGGHDRASLQANARYELDRERAIFTYSLLTFFSEKPRATTKGGRGSTRPASASAGPLATMADIEHIVPGTVRLIDRGLVCLYSPHAADS